MIANPQQSVAPYSGLGWIYDPKTRELKLLFEVADMAQDEDGNPEPAGVAIKLGPCGKEPDPEECAKVVAKIEAEGIGSGIDGKATAITWEKYVAEGYDDE